LLFKQPPRRVVFLPLAQAVTLLPHNLKA
jgi:hypothetical protein